MSYEYLNGIGTKLSKDKSLFKALPLFAVEVGEKIVEQLTENLRHHTASGRLEESISFNVDEVGVDKYKVSISMLDYGKYIDKGVRGKKSTYASAAQSPFRYKTKLPPYTPIAQWLSRKATSGVTKGGGKLPFKTMGKKSNVSEGRSRAYAVRKSIFNKGIEATGFYSKVVTDGMFEKINEELSKMVASKVIVEIVEIKI